jgi:hypothetical protein
VDVAAIVPNYPPASRVGAWLCTHRYLAHLAARGHGVVVIPRAGDHERAFSLDGVDVARSCESAVVHASRSDLVISHAGDAGYGAQIAATCGKPNVRLVHGHLDDPTALDGAELIVFNSHALAATLDCAGPSIVCHPPVIADEHRTTPGDRVTLVNMCEPKGGELFWRLARCSPRKFLGVRGDYGTQYIDSMPNVDVIPTTTNMRDDVWARTRILLMPSERETWGMVGVEAMASGIPVIAHPTDGLRESLGSAGVFVDREDGQGWLDAIDRLHKPKEWAKASARALARSAELDPTADLERFATAMESINDRRPAHA